MVHRKKKLFIDKKNSTTYRLLHRSQRDPLIVDDEVGQLVLHPVAGQEVNKRFEYGIYYGDDYDYFKHLKSVGEAIDLDGPDVDRTIINAPNAKKNLSSVIFETKGLELKVGLLNQAAPSNELFPNIDPDIAAALEGDIINDDESASFEDDFVLQLNADNGEAQPYPKENQMFNESAGKLELMNRFGLTREVKHFSDEDSCSNGEDNFSDGIRYNDDMINEIMEEDREERRTRFTNYSMSSAMIKRPDGLQIIDEHFETLYQQYDDEKCGQIEDESELISGHIDQNDERFYTLINDYALSKRKFVPEKPNENEKEIVLKMINQKNEQSSENEESEIDEDETFTKKQVWDCETILSQVSTHKNLPMEIKEEQVGFKRKRKLNSKLLDLAEDEIMDCSESVCTNTTTTTFRPKSETPEERRLRKAAVRAERRNRRVEKRMNKNAFKEQKKQFDRLRSQIQIKTRPIN